MYNVIRVGLISVLEKWWLFLHLHIGVWIDLGGEVPMIDLHGSRDSALQQMFVWIWQLSH